MKCPNCGRNVRSKQQCAHCGYVFDKNEKREQTNSSKQEKEFQTVEITPKTPKKKKGNGVGSFIWGLVKLVLMIAIVFLGIIFGPSMVSEVTDYFNQNFNLSKNDPEQTTVNKSENETSTDTESTSSNMAINSSSNNETTQLIQNESSTDNMTKQSTTTKENATTKEDKTTTKENNATSQVANQSTTVESGNVAKLSLADSKVNLDKYPIINVELQFEDDLKDVTQDTFKFKLASNGQEVPFDNEYSLVKEGKKVQLSFNDPNSLVLSPEEQTQKLTIEAKDFDFSEEVTYQTPKSNIDQEQTDQFNEVINSNLGNQGDLSAIVKEIGGEESLSFAYDDQTVESDILISWFVVERTLEAVKAGDITLDQIIATKSDLFADGDTGEIATVAEGMEYTVSSLITLVVKQQDVSAMNHLIDLTGGPNNFNLWLNESDYFSTKITEKFAIDDNGVVTGSVTNPKDIILLMENLANNQLIDESLDDTFKEELLQTPYSTKYPESNITGINRRYEITTSDINNKHQYYSAILETEERKYLVVILDYNFEDSEAAISGISTTLQQIMTYLQTGQIEEVTEETSSESTEELSSETQSTETPQVQIIGEETSYEEPPTSQIAEYTVQYIEGHGEVQLPIIRDENGNVQNVQWYYNEANQRYEYY